MLWMDFTTSPASAGMVSAGAEDPPPQADKAETAMRAAKTVRNERRGVIAKLYKWNLDDVHRGARKGTFCATRHLKTAEARGEEYD